MNTLWILIKKDLLRDTRHPWGLIVFMIVPVLTTVLMALVFSPQNDIQKSVVIEIAMLDRDDDLIAGLLRSFTNQGDAAQNLKLHFVETEAQGIQLVEKRKVSAFVMLPENLTTDLLDNTPTAIRLYKNPAESILPKIVEEGLNILCLGITQALRLIQPEIKTIRDMMDRDTMPDALDVADVALSSVQRLKTVEPYLFPPLIQFKTIDGSDYRPDPNRPHRLRPNAEGQAAVEDPNQ